MAFDYSRAFTVDDNGVSFSDENTDLITNISSNDHDPTTTGQDAPIGSLYMRTDGVLYIKTAAATTDWTPVSTSAGIIGLGRWTFSTTTTPPPADQGFRLNNATPASATKIYLDYDNDAAVDMTNFIQAISPGSVMYFQQYNDASNGFVAKVLTNTDQGTYAEIDIDDIEVFGTLANLRKFILVVSFSGSVQFINTMVVRAATTGDISLAAPGASIDGVAMASGDRVLVWQQTAPEENGVYIWNGAATPMTRTDDMDTWAEVPGRPMIAVEGTQYASSSFTSYSPYTGTIDTTPITINAGFRRIGPGNSKFELGDSWTIARATNAFGPRVMSLIDTNAVIRIWRYTATAANPSMEFIWGTNDDPADASNAWWDVALNEMPNEGIRIGKRGSATTSDLDAKLFASITGVRIGPDVAETNPAVALSIDATDAMLWPVGTTAQRPTGVNGYTRNNSTTLKFEGFENGAWRNFITSTTGGTLQLYAENPGTFVAPSATGSNAQAVGDSSVARLYGAFTDANGQFVAAGDAQTTTCVLRTQTTNTAATTEMFLDGTGGTQRMVLPNDTTWTFEILVTARRTDVDGTSAGYRFIGVIDRNTTAGSTAIVGAVSKTVLAEDNAAYDCNVNADTTNGSLRIQVNGTGTNTTRWVARVTLVEVTG